MSGGTCKIPRLQQMISDAFPSASVLYSTPPDEVLACGAAIEARALTTNYAHLVTNGVQDKPQLNGKEEKKTQQQQNGKEDKVGSKKKKNSKQVSSEASNVSSNVNKKKKAAPVRSHLPVLVTAVSVPVWCKVKECNNNKYY